MKKRFITKKRKRYSIFYLFFLFIIVALVLFSIYFKDTFQLKGSHDQLLKGMLFASNHYISYQYDKKNVVTKVVKFFSHVDLDSPFSILDHTYTGLVEPLEKMENSSSNTKTDKKEDVPAVSDQQEEGKAQVYIYNTHQKEEYRANHLEEYNIKPNVLMASYILREKLEKLGISSLVEENNVSEILNMNGWNYAASYQVTKMFMEDAKEKYPNINYFIDVHRDSVGRGATAVEINGVSYARMLFLVGLENPDYEKNLALATELHRRIEEQYPGLSRGIYKKQGPGVNGVYNQDVSPNVIVLEMGGVENTIEEVHRSTEIFAQVLYDYIGDKE